MTEHTDVHLWQQASRGSHAAFGTLYDRYAPLVYNYCFRRVADAATAEDLMAATFFEAWRKRRRVRLSGDSLKPWLLGVATNLIRNDRRSRRRRAAALARIAPDRPDPDPHRVVDEHVDEERRMARVLDQLRRLPDHEKEVLALVVWSGLSQEETAAALGIAVGTVKSRLSRARARLQGAGDQNPGSAATAELQTTADEPARRTNR